MQKEYRFKGFGSQGKLVQGTFMSESPKAAKAQLNKLRIKYQLRISEFEKKRD
jgi:hypothetical protein